MSMLGREAGSAMDTGKVLQCWDSDTSTNGYSESHQQSSADFTELRDGKHTDIQDIITAAHMAHRDNVMLIP